MCDDACVSCRQVATFISFSKRWQIVVDHRGDELCNYFTTSQITSNLASSCSENVAHTFARLFVVRR